MLLAGRSSIPLDSWVLVWKLGTAQVASWGILFYAFAVFLTPMQAELNLSVVELTGAFSLALGLSAITGLGVGRYLDRYSPRPLMTAGSLFASLFVLAWSRVDSVTELYLTFAGIGITMAMVLYEPAFIVITKTFSTKQREALTALTLVAAMASLVFSPLSERLIEALGWRQSLVVLAVVLAAVTVPIHALFLRPLPGGLAPLPDEPQRHRFVGASRSKQLPGFRLLTFSFVLATLASSSIAVLLVAMLVARGNDLGFAALTAGLMGVAQIPGRALFALVGRWLSLESLTAAPSMLMATALTLLTITPETWAVASAILFGMGAGMSTLARATVIGELYGRARYGRNSSVASAFVTGARAAAPLTAGAAALVFGYTSLLWALSGAAVVGAITAHRAVRFAEGSLPTESSRIDGRSEPLIGDAESIGR
jgi:MFS family permease